jgi:hypothetical protein
MVAGNSRGRTELADHTWYHAGRMGPSPGRSGVPRVGATPRPAAARPAAARRALRSQIWLIWQNWRTCRTARQSSRLYPGQCLTVGRGGGMTP